MSVPAEARDWSDRYLAASGSGAVGLLHDLLTHHVAWDTSLGRVYGRDDAIARVAWEHRGLRLCGIDDVDVFCGTCDGQSAIALGANVQVEHVGDSPLYGPPTGRSATLSSRVVGLMRANRVYRGWRFVDYGSTARALGVDLASRAVTLAAGAAKRGGIPWEFGEVRPGLGQTAPPDADDSPMALPADVARALLALRAAWNRRRPGLGAPQLQGAIDLLDPSHAWSRIVDACPDAVLFFERTVDSPPEGDERRVAVVWRWVGTHTGAGFGPPSGRRVHARGASVMRLRGASITEERAVFDELGVLRDLAIRAHENGAMP